MRLKEWESSINSKLRFINLRQIGGLILCGAGGVLIYLALEGFKKITAAQDFAHRFTNFFQHNTTWNPILKFFGGKAEENISQHEATAAIVLAAGIGLIVIGT